MPAYSLKFLVNYSYKAVGGMYTITFQLLKAMNVKKKKSVVCTHFTCKQKLTIPDFVKCFPIYRLPHIIFTHWIRMN